MTIISKIIALDIDSCFSGLLFLARKMFDYIFVFADNSNVIIGVSVFFSTIVVVLLSVIFVLVIKIILIRKPYKKGKPAYAYVIVVV